MREAGVLLRWGKVKPGHERAALGLFPDMLKYLEQKRQQGIITSFEPFLIATGDRDEEDGFLIIKGPEEGITALVRDPEWGTWLSKGAVSVHHLTTAMLVLGDAAFEQLERAGKAYAELGL